MSNMPKEWFFKIKPQEKWEDFNDWCLYLSSHTIASLNITPSSFWHVIIFPKNQFAKDIISKDTNGNYILSRKERADFLKTSLIVRKNLQEILNNNPEQIINIYKTWMNNEVLMEKINWCRERLQKIMENWNVFLKTQNWKENCYDGIWNSFENRGPHSWRMISTYHTQFVPQYWNSNKTIETSDALYFLLNNSEENNTPPTLTREEILNRKNWIIYENNYFKAILESAPVSFWHVAITWKYKNIQYIDQFSLEMYDNFFDSFNSMEKNLALIINYNYDEIMLFYKNCLDNTKIPETSKERIKKVIGRIEEKRTEKWWEIEDSMNEFYNAWWSFFPTIKSSWVYHFVPRYAFDRDKQWTGTALYKMFKNKSE